MEYLAANSQVVGDVIRDSGEIPIPGEFCPKGVHKADFPRYLDILEKLDGEEYDILRYMQQRGLYKALKHCTRRDYKALAFLVDYFMLPTTLAKKLVFGKEAASSADCNILQPRLCEEVGWTYSSKKGMTLDHPNVWAYFGDIDGFKWCCKQATFARNAACESAAKHGKLALLHYAYTHAYEWDVSTCHAAAMAGHLDCLKYAHENGCPWDASTCYAAAKAGHLDCLKYAYENGCPWNCTMIDDAHKSCREYLIDHNCYDWDWCPSD
jgi:hypothetical protein